MRDKSHFSLLAAVALAAIGDAQKASAQVIKPSIALSPALEATIAESHDALPKILNGDSSGYAALFADRDDVKGALIGSS